MLIARPTSRKIYVIMCKKDHISHANDDKKKYRKLYSQFLRLSLLKASTQN